jgi:hypothetical protein
MFHKNWWNITSFWAASPSFLPFLHIPSRSWYEWAAGGPAGAIHRRSAGQKTQPWTTSLFLSLVFNGAATNLKVPFAFFLLLVRTLRHARNDMRPIIADWHADRKQNNRTVVNCLVRRSFGLRRPITFHSNRWIYFLKKYEKSCGGNEMLRIFPHSLR